jgi:spore germination cell wall hydrolase CwlJ-like protein
MKTILLSFLFAIGLQAKQPELTTITLAAAVLVAEAGGEGPLGLAAVWNVIETRVKERQQPLAYVLTDNLQFSCLNSTTPQQLLNRAVKHPAWAQAVYTVYGYGPRLNMGANHYHARMIKKPYWTIGQRPIFEIGNHLFYAIRWN